MTGFGKAKGLRQAKAWAVRHATELRPLLEADKPMLKEDMPEATAKMIPQGQVNAAIQIADRIDEGGKYIHLWELNPAIEDMVQSHIDHADILPCGHTGLQNLRDGGYSCGVEVCDAEYSRETVEEVYG